MSITSKACAGMLVASLTACMGTRPSAPPDSRIEAPPAWRHGEAAENAAIPENWWHEFGDAQLDAIVDLALRKNDDLQIAVARVAEARGVLSLSRAALLPHLQAQAPGLREAGISPFGVADQDTGGGFGASIAYDADVFGRLRNERGAARARWLESQGARDSIRLSVASSTAASYIALRALDSRLEIAQSTLTVRADSLRVAQRRYALGYSTALEVKQAEAEYLATEQLIPQLHLSIESQENALSVLLGGTPHSVLRGARLEEIETPLLPRALPSTVVRQRPDIYAAEAHLIATDHALSAARAAFLPDLTLQAGIGRAFSTLYPDPISIWSIGGSVLAPLFEGGALRAQQRIESARRDQAAFAYRRTVLTAFKEVEDQMTAIQDSGEQLQILIAEQDALTAATRVATRRYRRGYSSYIEQLDAERSLLDAQLSVVRVRALRLLAFVDLYRAMGGGWHQPDRRSADLHGQAVSFK